MPVPPNVLDVESAVKTRYSGAAKAPEASLCCPTRYDKKLLAAIPEEVLERDYGCGDPTVHLKAGETVLDLGSGSGKICFLASQVVGPAGKVIGIDMNDDMLALARRSAPEVSRRLGFQNVSFGKARIQDLALDLEALDATLRESPVRSAEDLARLEGEVARQRQARPLVASDSVDVVVSNCVLNLVRPEDKRALFAEIHRVLRAGGRAVISDIVCDEEVPEKLQADPELWSGCISGAFREDHFLEAFEEAGFQAVTLTERGEQPWRTVEGIEFRSVTVVAYKVKAGACLDQKHAVIYRGPFREVSDDAGQVLRRGVRSAVCEKTFHLYSREPYRAHFELIAPTVLVPLDQCPPFNLEPGARRDPRDTRGPNPKLTSEARAKACCSPRKDNAGSCC